MVRNILVIDDDDLVRAMVVRILQRAGYSVTEATDGEKGIRAFERDAPDVIITDIVMPNQDGIDVLRRVKSCPQRMTKILAMSGGSLHMFGIDYLNVAKCMGADAVIQKPFSPDSLVAAVEAAVRP